MRVVLAGGVVLCLAAWWLWRKVLTGQSEYVSVQHDWYRRH